MAIGYAVRGKKILYLMADALIVSVSWLGSRYLAGGGLPPFGEGAGAAVAPAIMTALYLIAAYLFQVYRVMWTYGNLRDMARLMAAQAAAFTAALPVLYAVGAAAPVVVLALFFTMAALVSLFYRIMLRQYAGRANRDGGELFGRYHAGPVSAARRILVVGAGEAGSIILAEYARLGLGRIIAGFVDDDPEKAGTMLNGRPVFGDTAGIGAIIDGNGITEVMFAIPSAGSSAITRIVSIIRKTHRSIPLRSMPGVSELNERNPLRLSIRDISIIDLIGRDEVRVNTGLIEEQFTGRTVLVTGAGGSIGAEICRQLMNYRIARLVAVGRGEFSIYGLVKSLNEFTANMADRPEIVYRIADIKDRALMESIFARYRPDVVFHAAAHKHVPLMEFNEAEALQNNVGGTRTILELSASHGAGKFLLISTDKAVNPSSVMGATKRLAEMVTSHYGRTRGLVTAMVRFGNVIGSRGSVIPLFMEQIERGGPVTITHPEVTRYFMSIPEASLLVINAAALAKGGELFALDMGRQFRVTEIAERLIELYGYRSDRDIMIEYTGLRPGEKLYEELFYAGDSLTRTANDKIFVLADPGPVEPAMIERFLAEDLPAVAGMDQRGIRELIRRMVPGFESDDASLDGSSNRKLVN